MRGRATLAAAWLLASLPGCVESVVWHGRSPDRRREVEVLERSSAQRIRLDGAEGPPFRGIGVETVAFSPDSRRLAYAAQDDAGWRVVIGDRAGPAWGGIGALLWSPDSRRLAYAAERDGGWRVVVDGRPGPAFDALLEGSLRWSADSRRVAYLVERRGRRSALLDDLESAQYDAIGELTLGADGSRAGFIAWQGSGARAVLLDQAGAQLTGPLYDGIAELRLSARGGRPAYAALRDPAEGGPRGWAAVIDGVEGPLFDRVGSLAWAPDDRRLVYVARHQEIDQVMVVDVRAAAPRHAPLGPAFPAIVPASLVLDAEGERLAYIARREDGLHAVVLGLAGGAALAEGPAFDAVEALSLPPGRSGYLGHRGGRSWVVLDGAPSIPYEWAGDLVFSPDGRHHAYLARRAGRTLIAQGDRRFGVDQVVEGTLVVDDTGRWGCVVGVRAARGLAIVIGGLPLRRLPIDELVAALMQAPPDARLRGALDTGLLRRWVAAELALRARSDAR